MRTSFRLGIVQLCARQDVEENLRAVATGVHDAAEGGADFVLLPENLAYMGPEAGKLAMAEPVGTGPISAALASLARRAHVYLAAGGIPECAREVGKVHNTFVVFAPNGDVCATYRKIHLFDIHIPEAIDILESSTVAPGCDPVVLSTPLATFGLSICYDLRFPELYRKLALAGAEVMLVPAAFTAHTGRDHWHVLLRARAIENTCYVAAAGQFGQHMPGRVSYGRSAVVDPWGRVLAEAPDGELSTVVVTIDLERLRAVRRGMPSLQHIRCNSVSPDAVLVCQSKDNQP
ncbi:MAG: carbon-nitrogen hydrolase family protein [Candidatus Schekmanbacteria bacterium]|nr:carbon-nitrogen hydrolase family protein [Candidatus Schekmanbacteria bacterium]